MTPPIAYLITFSTYGSHLHGDERGSVNRDNNGLAQRLLEPNRAWLDTIAKRMSDTPILLTASDRELVRTAIKGVCEFHRWTLFALHVRTNHVHAVVSAEASASRVLHSLKSYATRALNERSPHRPRWSSHGSTRYLWSRESLDQAVRYVLEGQGEAMSVAGSAITS